MNDLAAAPDSDVMAAWAGLGYYARARNLLACARAVARDHGGVFPGTEADLLKLPGVGAYTAAAVAAIAFGRPANVVDGNVERVMARLFAVETPLPAARPRLKALATRFVIGDQPGAEHADWPQALMDLGATVCRPKSPLCDRCPVAFGCAALTTGDPGRYPLKVKKGERPHRHGIAWVLRDGEGRVGLVRRPDKGLLGGMLGLPTSNWGESSDATATCRCRLARGRGGGACLYPFQPDTGRAGGGGRRRFRLDTGDRSSGRTADCLQEGAWSAALA